MYDESIRDHLDCSEMVISDFLPDEYTVLYRLDRYTLAFFFSLRQLKIILPYVHPVYQSPGVLRPKCMNDYISQGEEMLCTIRGSSSL